MEPGVVHVAIVASSACHSCSARQMCGMSESQEKIIDVHTSEAETFQVGDTVRVGEEKRMALRAVLVAYVGALVVLVGLLVLLIALGASEGVAALTSLAGVAIYYGGVYLARRKIEHTIYFTITKS